MNIYISHSNSFDFKNELYLPLKQSTLAKKHTLIFPHDTSRESYPTQKLLEEKKCDVIIAEVSYPATGQGIELGWAYLYRIPIICIYQEKSDVSNSLKLLSNTFIPYQEIDESLCAKIQQSL